MEAAAGAAALQLADSGDATVAEIAPSARSVAAATAVAGAIAPLSLAAAEASAAASRSRAAATAAAFGPGNMRWGLLSPARLVAAEFPWAGAASAGQCSLRHPRISPI